MLDLTASPSHIISEINRLAQKVDGDRETAPGDQLSDEDAKTFREIMQGKGDSLTAADVKDAINKLNDLHGKFLPSPGLPIDPGPPKPATAETPVMPAPMGAAKPPLEHKATPDAAAADRPPQPATQGAAVPPQGQQGSQSTPPPKPPILPSTGGPAPAPVPPVSAMPNTTVKPPTPPSATATPPK